MGGGTLRRRLDTRAKWLNPRLYTRRVLRLGGESGGGAGRCRGVLTAAMHCPYAPGTPERVQRPGLKTFMSHKSNMEPAEASDRYNEAALHVCRLYHTPAFPRSNR